MNFLFLNSARNWGGNEKWIYVTTQALAAEHNVYFAYRKGIIGKRFKITKFRLSFLNEFDLYTILKLFFIIKKYQIQVLIPSKPKEYVIAGILSKICHRKNILRLGIVRELRNSRIKDIVYNRLADGIIVNAESIKQGLLKSTFMKSEKIKVIHNGVNTDEIDVLSNALTNIDKPCRFLVCSMGQLSKRKSMDIVLKGFADFKRRVKTEDAGLIIIGRGEKLEALQILSDQLGIKKNVIFTGFLENPYPYLKMSDIFITTSINEGISNALLEAMYLKNAVISTAVGGSDYAIESGVNGFLLSRNPVAEISDHLVELYDDESLRHKLAEQAHQTILQKFSLQRMKEEIVNYCLQIVGD